MTPQEALNAAEDAYYAATNVLAAEAALDRMTNVTYYTRCTTVYNQYTSNNKKEG